MAKLIEDTKVVTNEVRFSYANVFVPTAIDENSEKKYNVSILIPKTDTETIELIKKAIANAVEDGKSQKWGGKLPSKKEALNPLRDGDVEYEEGAKDVTYKGCYFINAKSSRKPGIVDKHHNVLTTEEEFYSGCYGHASINFYAYDKGASKGIAVGLNSLLKSRDGERLGNVSDPETEFEDFFDENSEESDW